MKSFIIKIVFILSIAGIASCGKDALRSYDSKQQLDAVENVNNGFLMSSIIRKTAQFYQRIGYDDSRLPGAVQYMVRNYQGGDNYYSAFKQPANDLYGAMEILKLVDGAIDQAEKRETKSYKGTFMIFRAILFSFMTDYYGDIYYSEALKGREGILYPKYDKQQDIYAGILAELEEANTLIAEGTDVITSNEDLLYGGDKTEWQKFANSVRLRLLMRASNKLTDAGSKMQAIVSNTSGTPIFTEVADNAAISYPGTTQQNAWAGGKLNWSDKGEFDRRRPSKTIIDKLESLNDPRLAVWFAPIEEPWTSNGGLDGVTVTTTDPNGYEYTSTWKK